MNPPTTETCDRNKTDLTRRVTAGALAWMYDQGFKPVETEVPVAKGWVADLAGVIVPTPTECANLRLLGRKPQKYGPEMTDWRARCNSLPSPLTGLIEVKTTGADFTRDRKWEELVLPTDLAWVAVPAGLILEAECLFGWGLIECHPETGLVARVVRRAHMLRPVSAEQRLQILLEVATRQHNTHHHARLREIQRQALVKHNDAQTASRLSDAVSCVLAIARGKTVDEAIEWSLGFGKKVPDWCRSNLEEFAVELTKRITNEVGLLHRLETSRIRNQAHSTAVSPPS